MHDRARFFTVTAEHVNGTPMTVRERQEALEAVHEEFVHVGSSVDDEPDDVDEEDPEPRADSKPTQSLDLEDEELLERARSAKNGAKFDRLWRGSTQGYASRSEADMALCCLLAFWTGRDRARIDRLFRQSGLMRVKWDEVHYADGSTYGEKTVERAIANTTDVYDPSEKGDGGVNRADSTGTPEEQGGTSPTASTSGGTDGAKASYLVEKNHLLSNRVADLEATLEEKDERIERLEEENQELRDTLVDYRDQLERLSEHSNLEVDTDTASEETSIWARARRLVGGRDE